MDSRYFSVIVSLIFIMGSAISADAEIIRLKNQTKVSGDVLQVDDDDVVIRLPREAVDTINGEALPPALAEGAKAPGFTATDMAGNAASVGLGKAKATLLHFWVHWCPHCRSDSPHVQAIYEQYKNDPNVKVVTVNLDDAKQKKKVEALIKDKNLTFPVVMTDDPVNQAAASKPIQELYQITGFPVTFLIDGQGIIRYKRRGSFSEGGEDLEGEIQKLLTQT